MRRASLLASLVLVLVMAFGSVALAGEVKGPPSKDGSGAQGGPTPVDGFWFGTGAASICSFSGLNDGDWLGPSLTQSYGSLVVQLSALMGLTIKEVKDILDEEGESPGVLCNPKRAPFGNPKK